VRPRARAVPGDASEPAPSARAAPPTADRLVRTGAARKPRACNGPPRLDYRGGRVVGETARGRRSRGTRARSTRHADCEHTSCETYAFRDVFVVVKRRRRVARDTESIGPAGRVRSRKSAAPGLSGADPRRPPGRETVYRRGWRKCIPRVSGSVTFLPPRPGGRPSRYK